MVKTITSDSGYMKLNLSQGVGPGRANNIDDVSYVQFLLNQVVQHPKFSAMKLSCKKNGAKLKVDGLIGPKTNAQIKAFQLYYKGEGWGNIADGCVDTVRGMLTPTKKFYTLSLFDWALMGMAEGTRLDTNSLIDRPDFPPRIKAIALRVRSHNAQLAA